MGKQDGHDIVTGFIAPVCPALPSFHPTYSGGGGSPVVTVGNIQRIHMYKGIS